MACLGQEGQNTCVVRDEIEKWHTLEGVTTQQKGMNDESCMKDSLPLPVLLFQLPPTVILLV